jgi:hypothetical protein
MASINHLAVAAFRFLAFVLAGLTSFLAGCFAAIFVLLRVFAPPANCPSPCDASAYVALGAAVFVAPVVGILFAGGGIYALSRLWRRKSGVAA